MLQSIQFTQKERYQTSLLQNSQAPETETLRILVQRQERARQRFQRAMTLVVITAALTGIWTYGPEYAAIAVARYQQKSVSLQSQRLPSQIASRSRAILPLVEASENAASQYLHNVPNVQFGVSAFLKITRSVLTVAQQLGSPYGV
jgi:hypothetical protein